MKKLLVFFLLTALALPAAAFAATNEWRDQPDYTTSYKTMYVGPKLGVSWSRFHDTPDGFGNHRYVNLNIGGFLGYNFEQKYQLPIRAEIDLTVRGGDDTSGAGRDKIDVNVFNTLLGYIWWDIPIRFVVQPYVGGGMGISMAYFDARSGNTTENNEFSWAFAWSLGGGVMYRLKENVTLDIGYRYVDTSKFDSDAGDFDFRMSSHDLSAGLRFEF